MSFSFGFYNSLSHDRVYDAIQMSKIFDGLINDGVYATVGDHFIVRESSDENMVIVGSGRAWFNHTWNYNDTDLPIEAPLPDLLTYRWDALVIDVNENESYRLNQLLWVQGTGSLSNPVKPTMIHTLEHNQYPLCYVYRRPNTNLIVQADIENAVGTSACPFVTGIIETIDIDELALQWAGQWTQFMNTYTTQIENWTAAQEAAFTAYVNEFQLQMSEWENAYKSDADDWKDNFEAVMDYWKGNYISNAEDWENTFESDSTNWWNNFSTALINWFENMQGQISSDAAVHLQAEIDALKYFYVQDGVLYFPNTHVSVSNGVMTVV